MTSPPASGPRNPLVHGLTHVVLAGVLGVFAALIGVSLGMSRP